MSGKSPAALAVTGLALAFGGFAFARMGWSGLRAPAAPPARAGIEAPAPATALLKRAFSLLVLLFGLFALGCGLILMLALVLPEAQA
jgi:hypothetical protein